jgi:hypothetical protein
MSRPHSVDSVAVILKFIPVEFKRIPFKSQFPNYKSQTPIPNNPNDFV